MTTPQSGCAHVRSAVSAGCCCACADARQARPPIERPNARDAGRKAAQARAAASSNGDTASSSASNAASASWADLLAGAYNVLPPAAAAFRPWTKLMHRRSDTLYEDAMIAATAQQHGLFVVTPNIADFAHFSANLFNPSAPAQYTVSWSPTFTGMIRPS